MMRIGRVGSGLLGSALLLAACGRSAANHDEDPSQAGEPANTGGDGAASGTATSGGTSSGGASSGGTSTVGAGGASAADCEPGTKSCDGASVRVCSDDGIARIETTCTPAQVCQGGACHDIACVPGSTFCDGQVVRQCGADGTTSDVKSTCSASQFCSEQGTSASCGDTVCQPGAGLCVDGVATQCRSDGSGPKPGGTDCSKAGSVCTQGTCAEKLCTAGERLCQQGNVYFCVDGSHTVPFAECGSGEVCDPNLAVCAKVVCSAGDLSCDGTRIVKCNELGTGYDQIGTDCASSDQVCSKGACETPICKPGATFCKDGNVQTCDATGLAPTVTQVCSSLYYHCGPSGTGAACLYNSCVAGSAACNGNVATKCNTDGSGYESGGTDCGTDKVCSAGSCQPKVCTGYGYFCKDKNVAYCQGGLTYSLIQDCGSDARCVAMSSSGTAACVPYACQPKQTGCLGNQVGTCDSDGTALASVSQDCTATSQVCVNGGTCADSAVDTLGTAEELQSLNDGYFFGDIIDVNSERRLTELEANVVLASERNLRFVVFEGTTSNQFVARYDQLLKNQSGSGYQSSGAIDYTLHAGRRYALGVAVSGGGFVPYYDAAPWKSTASFGSIVGPAIAAYASTVYLSTATGDRIYDLRITTELP